ncbi:MAG: veratrol--corrinoid protein metyltransferase [Spirochaetaceae bacterium]|nr:veratrol--corrinoid protein metyltransferase [Spirochaetaceae bacterium]
MTEKENFLRVLKGETPAWVPRYTMGMPDPYATHPIPCVSIGYTNWGMKPDGKGGMVDMFGVPYTSTEETGGMFLPTPNVFVLDDIRKWRDVIKLPSLDGFDWEGEAKKAMDALDARLKNMGVSRNEVAVQLGTHIGYFQHICNFMGFTEGLCALLEEQEAVHELYAYLADFYDKILANGIKYFKPDVVGITDDTATATHPFMSKQVWHDVIMPYHVRLGRQAQEKGIPVMMHNCGRCEDFIDDWMSYGVGSWNPAQVVNDLDGIKKKHGNRLVLIGCWDSQGPAGWPDATEAVVRQAVRDCIDRFAPGGGFMFWGSRYGAKDDQNFENQKRWMTEEYEAYREHPYR